MPIPSKKPPSVDPARFVEKIDNPYVPMVPGTKFHYEGTTKDGRQSSTVEVTDQTKEILGVQTVVVRDVARENGKVVEDTFDWYAQDRDGNVWYFGEHAKTMKNGKVVNTEGSWEAGKKGAKPGILMKARPKVGDKYQQERAKGVAEDRAEVLSTDKRVRVGPGSFDHVLETRDDTPLEPKLAEHKYHAKGVGTIRTVAVKGEQDQLDLVAVDKP